MSNQHGKSSQISWKTNRENELSELCLCAILVLSFNKEGKSIREIAVLISRLDGCEDIWIENEYRIMKENALYKPFKEYLMKKLKNSLF